MDVTYIKNLLINSGFTNINVDDGFISFDDPTCILPAFDTMLHYAWIVVMTLTGIMLFGWAILYIKNGVKIGTLFNNAKVIILILGTLSIVKPIVSFIYGDNLFAKQCEQKRVSLTEVEKLLALREKHFGTNDQAMLYETFVVSDTGKVKSVSVEESTEE